MGVNLMDPRRPAGRLARHPSAPQRLRWPLIGRRSSDEAARSGGLRSRFQARNGAGALACAERLAGGTDRGA